ncbi:MAG: hypothetical protein AMJ90_01995 [candidate division Zixibacteria bacterium SM23_73_2]|nr:MAG: hypothetical protein AMJ90_01995 [candidate division Zixibacteria bacterium SM23_73_2]
MDGKAVPDNELFKRVLDEDRIAFEALVNRYKIKLYNLVYRMLGTKEEAEDILQETFLRVYRERNSFDFNYQFSTWIYTIALNLTRNELKKKKRFKFFGLESLLRKPAQSYLSEDFGNFKGEFQYYLEKEMKSLPEKYKKAFLLRDINELSYEEISNVLEIPLGTVKSRVNRARGILRKKLKPKMEGVYELSKGSTIPAELL